MEVSLVAAVADNGVLGHQGRLPWNFPADMRVFRSLTRGHAVLLGRRTWESLGKPLADRRHFVVTRHPTGGSPTFNAEWPPSVTAHASVETALAAAESEGHAKLFVIGGATLYEAFLRDTYGRLLSMHITHVHLTPEGDTWFPTWDGGAWNVGEEQTLTSDGLTGTYRHYVRR